MCDQSWGHSMVMYFSYEPHLLGDENHDESPNKHFPLVPNHKNDKYICKLALKMVKIGTLKHLVARLPVPKASNAIDV
jgi:hypothetical protein